MEPLLALDRWIRYTQSELQSLRADTIQQREDEKFVHRIQQGQLDSIQAQVREISQQCAELTEAITGPFNHVRQICRALDRIVHDFNQYLDSVSSSDSQWSLDNKTVGTWLSIRPSLSKFSKKLTFPIELCSPLYLYTLSQQLQSGNLSSCAVANRLDRELCVCVWKSCFYGQ